MTTILILDDGQSEMLTFGLAIALQRQALAEIMQERLRKAADGKSNVSEWKMTRFNSLIYRVSRLQALIATVDAASQETGLADSERRERWSSSNR